MDFLDASLVQWLEAGWVEVLPGCEPLIPPAMTVDQALLYDFIRFTLEGKKAMEERIAQLERELGIVSK